CPCPPRPEPALLPPAPGDLPCPTCCHWLGLGPRPELPSSKRGWRLPLLLRAAFPPLALPWTPSPLPLPVLRPLSASRLRTACSSISSQRPRLRPCGSVREP